MKIREIRVELKLDGTHERLVCVDDVGLLGDNINNIDAEAVMDDSKEEWPRNKRIGS
jgi:hypothetical protein